MRYDDELCYELCLQTLDSTDDGWTVEARGLLEEQFQDLWLARNARRQLGGRPWGVAMEDATERVAA